MNTLVIEKSALKNNISRVKELAGGAYIYANLSGDGYGAGALPLAQFLRDEGSAASVWTVPKPLPPCAKPAW